mgnify:CR=1 FL=1
MSLKSTLSSWMIAVPVAMSTIINRTPWISAPVSSGPRTSLARLRILEESCIIFISCNPCWCENDFVFLRDLNLSWSDVGDSLKKWCYLSENDANVILSEDNLSRTDSQRMWLSVKFGCDSQWRQFIMDWLPVKFDWSLKYGEKMIKFGFGWIWKLKLDVEFRNRSKKTTTTKWETADRDHKKIFEKGKIRRLRERENSRAL